jgi:hypothetical protein|tara:strand:+ start:752 stop:1240 length:489 start_codon:yes stop_codon:yes gene_type:complete
MAILNPNEIFFTAFEPKQSNRFILYMDGIPSFLVKGVGGINVAQTAVALNHINVQRYVKGKTIWGAISMTLFESITPSGAQAVMEWIRLGHESVTGRDGYSDFYKKDLTFNVLGPVGDIVSEWIIKGAVVTSANFGDYNWDDDGTIVNIALEVQPDYCILNY